ncbi:cobalamin biosynthesis protein [Candidatus Geothermarchaeota archaeon]|nr:MAG: cobalamin biosynthesis protein [Candidatus Geothermarchaeota archaeon]
MLIIAMDSLMVKTLIFMLAICIDLIADETRGRLVNLHPVRLSSRIAEVLKKPFSSKVYGVFLWLSSICPIVLLFWLIQEASMYLGFYVYVIVSALLLKTTFSIRMLRDIVLRVFKSSKRGDWNKAREATQEIVRRNVYELDEEHVLSAAIESLAESAVDGVISPLLYYPFFGVLGSLLQRLANTLDGIVGYKSPELKNIGWFSAKMDTLLNYLPSRLTAILLIISATILRLDHKNGVKILIRDRSKTESINAGWPMAAIAGVLRIRLEKKGHYVLGDPIEPLTPEKVLEAIHVVDLAIFLTIILILVLSYVVFFSWTSIASSFIEGLGL